MEKFPKGKPERLPSGRDALRAAILAATTAIAPAHSADAESLIGPFSQIAQKIPQGEKLSSHKPGEDREDLRSAGKLDVGSFKELLRKKRLSEDEEGRMEIAVYRNEVPVREQLAYMQRMFRPHGKYFDELYGVSLSSDRLSVILGLVDRVSARMNQAYVLRELMPENLDLFKHADSVIAATRPMNIHTESGFIYCNTFFSRGFDGQVYQDIAAHCGKKPLDLGKLGFVGLPEGADVASRIIVPEDFKKEQVPDPVTLPLSIPSLSGSDVVGLPTLSYSVSPRGVKKMYFSILLPYTARVQELLGYGKGAELDLDKNGLLFMLMPEVEAHVITTDPTTGATAVNASGSSGSGMFVDINGLLVRVGSFIQERILTPDVQNFKYAVSVINAPRSHTSAQEFSAMFERWKSEIAPTLDATQGRR